MTPLSRACVSSYLYSIVTVSIFLPSMRHSPSDSDVSGLQVTRRH